MAYEHESGLPMAFDRAKDRGDLQGVVQPADRFVQGASLNEMQTIIRQRGRRVAAMTAKDGNRISGAAALAIREDEDDLTGQLILTAGEIFVLGDVFPVAAKVIDTVSMIGRVEIGVRISRVWQDYEDNPDLLGIAPGTLAEGEPGAAHELVTISWALADDGGEGDFVLVYLMVDGTIIDQTPPPVLEGVINAIAIYDEEAHGNYIARGCRVTALGKSGADQVFSIEEGSANINGYKRTRYASLRYMEEEAWDIEEIAGETHTYPGGASATFPFFHSPMATINSVLVTKEVTATITRGPVAGTADALPNNSVTSILEVKQGGTTYATPASWVKAGDSVDWSPGGAEPLPGSSYTVKYHYLALVTPDAATATEFTVSGGVADTLVIVGYDYKLPRIDLLCLDRAGLPVYLKGVSARQNPLPPPTPSNLLKLCEVHNNWLGKPRIENNGTRSVTYDRLSRVIDRVEAHERLLELERIKSGIDAREPTAKKGLFVDPFVSDFYRDNGVSQNAAIGEGIMQLAIAPTIFLSPLTAPVTLDYTEEVVIEQSLVSGCMKVNPYQSFVPLPGALRLSPAVDFWEEAQTIWASPVTLEFNRGIRQDNGPLVVTSEATETLGERQELQEFLRIRAVDFEINGFGAGEILESLTIDGRDITPAGPLVADSAGDIVGSFTIPSNITAGSKEVVAEGAGGTFARALYTGQGIINITTMRRVTTIERYAPRPNVEAVPQPPIQPGWPQPPVVIRPLPPIRRAEGGRGSDPLAQTFWLTEPRQLIGMDFKLCLIGDPSNALLVHQVPVDDGIPTSDILAEAFVPMAGAALGWKTARYDLPLLSSDEREWAFVVKTDDALHSLSIASVGGFDADQQSHIGAQPYAVGVLLSSSNARTWTPHQNDDLAFRVVAAKFGPLTKTVPLGSFNLVNASDLQVRAAVELPSPECSVVFEIVRGSGEVWRVEPYQVLQLSEYITETVQLRAVLSGTEKLSPVLYAPVQLLAGEIAQVGTYVCRAFSLGSAVKLTSYFKAALPFGSSVTIEYDKADGNWQTLPYVSTEALSDPAWVENKYEATGITATQGRLKITITGGPAARPRVGDLGAAVM